MTKPSDSFRTPPSLFKGLDSVFNFFWDATCDKDNCLVEAQKAIWVCPYDYLNLDTVELHKKIQLNFVSNRCIGAMGDSLYMNPPYSNPLPFIRKAWEDAKHFRVVMLLKADMSTKWFNYALKENNNWIMHINQGDMGIGEAAQELLDHMDGCCACSPKDKTCKGCDDKDPRQHQIGVLHLRNRVKFYVSEEVMLEDAKWERPLQDFNGIKSSLKYNNQYSYKPVHYGVGCPMEAYETEDQLIETKNYKRVEDGIVSRSGANFPSIILIFDRRENK